MANNFSKIRVGGVPEHFNLPWKKWLSFQNDTKRNFDWEWTDFPGGSGAMLQALKEEKIDLALVLTEAVANAIKQGAEIEPLSIYVESPLVWGIFSGKNNPISSISPVFDKKYAISRPGSGSQLMAKVDARLRGENLEEAQFIVVQDLEGAKKALQKGDADLFLWEKWMTKPLVDQGIFKMLDERPTPWPCFILVARSNFWNAQAAIQNEIKSAFELVLVQAKLLKNKPDGHLDIARAYSLENDDSFTWLAHVEWTKAWRSPEEELELAKKILAEV
jgi:ABC-type nitrate/sulfonate/bicarbonate transport system substrate-binding protein